MMTNVVGCPPDEVHSGMAVAGDLGAAERRPAAAALPSPADGGRGRERSRGQARRRGARACCTRGGRRASPTAWR